MKLGEIFLRIKESASAQSCGVTDETEVDFLVYHAGHIGFQSGEAGARFTLRPKGYPLDNTQPSPSGESVARSVAEISRHSESPAVAN